MGEEEGVKEEEEVEEEVKEEKLRDRNCFHLADQLCMRKKKEIIEIKAAIIENS